MAEDEKAQLDPLRTYELRLLRCSIPSDYLDETPPPPSKLSNTSTASQLHSLIENLLQLIESGQYRHALSSEAGRTLFNLNSSHLPSLFDSADQFYNESVVKCVESFIYGDNCEENDNERCYRAFLVMAIAVAALLSFTQCNITGTLNKSALFK
ncbi:unnamed protein product [Ilex paraguariensis]|uniref:Uncharacterized protein n=1 Tax=Ilex paraguariensis TaxID=185542 RepID=A0ABC8T4V2_9AQUA